MKNNLRVALILAAFYFPFVNMPENFAQQVQPPIVGGYKQVDTTDSNVVSTAKFAVNTQRLKQGRRISLVSVERAEMQIVAGRNYQLWLKVKNNNQIQRVTTVVYQDLQQKYSLSSWKVKSCNQSPNQ
jgi:hypothetical protein